MEKPAVIACDVKDLALLCLVSNEKHVDCWCLQKYGIPQKVLLQKICGCIWGAFELCFVSRFVFW